MRGPGRHEERRLVPQGPGDAGRVAIRCVLLRARQTLPPVLNIKIQSENIYSILALVDPIPTSDM